LEALDFLKNIFHASEYVVLHPKGIPWTDSTYRKYFTKARIKIGFTKHWTNHGLRHSFATNYLKQGGDMEQLQKKLGHSSLEMTVDLYGKMEAEDIPDPSPFDF